MDWDKLRIFHAVADKGSLTHAGDVLHLSQSAVSRQIRALEESLSVTLFHRHARGLILTEQGELLFDATQAMVKRLDATAARIRDSEDEVFGELRVTTTTGFGTLWLAPRLARFAAQHPEVTVNLSTRLKPFDFEASQFDAAIHYGRQDWPGVEYLPLMQEDMLAVAAPSLVPTPLSRAEDVPGLKPCTEAADASS